MKIRHDVDATTLKRRTKAKVAAATLSLLVVAGAASTATPSVTMGLKALHDGGGCCSR